ncbi:YhjD/YihY/BrkB family envelope integrity protein [Streptomyces vilmorinianum]|uniref:YhjD/YihY/BrkB family envelope integrity protein n=1 Tax=Streptomyces vilmorinianum TaxID=3051092 RepID=UPI0020C7ACE9|nr:YhjD/YihY/BrkB family envelope integrity protein [Streptomyces vilmorinianum]
MASPVLRLGRRLLESLSRAAGMSGGLELTSRSMVFAALGFLAFVPLMMVIAAADPARAAEFGRWLARALSASEPAEREILELFARPRRVLRDVTAFGLAALCVFGLTFAAHVRQRYEAMWAVRRGRSRGSWRGRLRDLARYTLWLALLIGYLLLLTNTPLRRADTAASPLGTSAALLVTFLFTWTSQKILLGRRLRWRALLPGAVATTLGPVGLRLFAQLVFSPLIVSQATA